ncbi:hypothetical protein HJG60_011070 [Phyllostomus discolor]|uniref:Uncharacterized protein n=1 Tax=Phyllostomus discolor TaxID=89673 RepID=A0A834EAH4_9CHIR|nr:hypothetical protein HJG60_011070 [Phyllostomus discolor]
MCGLWRPAPPFHALLASAALRPPPRLSTQRGLGDLPAAPIYGRTLVCTMARPLGACVSPNPPAARPLGKDTQAAAASPAAADHAAAGASGTGRLPPLSEQRPEDTHLKINSSFKPAVPSPRPGWPAGSCRW